MIYSKTTWRNGVTKVNADNMNKIEQGIYDAQEVAQKFIINGTITNSAVEFNSLVVADLISAINNNNLIMFKATNNDIQDFIINTQKISGENYTLIGNYTINNSGVITNYELTITIVDNVTEGSISIVSGASVSSADFSGSNTQLNGLNINGTNYKLLDVKENDGSNLIIGSNRSLADRAVRSIAIGNCVSSTVSGDFSTALGNYSTASGYASTAIGSYSTANNDFSTALGNYSTASGSDSIALGDSSKALGDSSIAIGSSSAVYVPSWVSFDMRADDLARTVALKSTDNIFFRNENVDESKKEQSSYTSGKTLTQVLNTKQDALVRIYISAIRDEATGPYGTSLVFVGYRDEINGALENIGLDLGTLISNWQTLRVGEQATQIWSILSYCFSCFYTPHGGDIVSPIINDNYLGYILLNGTTPVGHVVFNSETGLKTAFAHSSIELDDDD